ncbi:MAG: flagellar hook-basal body complex protein, partial [Pseudomonadota bacterium]
MTISSSLNAGVAGLTANATRLAAISDNIANSGTFGYKRVEANFESLVLSQNGGRYSAGGVTAGTQRLIDESGSLVNTSNPTDLAVSGRGLLPVALISEVEAENGSPQMLLTTTGSFRTDSDGRLVTESGLVLLGWPANADGSIPQFSRDTSDGLAPVQISANQLSGEPTTQVDLGLNLPAVETDFDASGDPLSLSVEYFDNLGRSESLLFTFTPSIPGAGSSNEWTLTIEDSAQTGVTIGEYNLVFDDGRTSGGRLASVTDVSGGPYDPATGSFIVNVEGGPMEINIGVISGATGLTQLSDSFAPLQINKDGSPVGNLIAAEVDENGFVFATFDSGITRVIYQIPLVDVPNPNGMTALAQQTYLPSTDSGTFFLWDAGDGPTGEVVSFAREESATDVAGELTD